MAGRARVLVIAGGAICLGVVLLAAGCTAPDPVPESLGVTQSALICANPEGGNSGLAALAVASAKELGRWQVTTDMAITLGPKGERLMLTATGLARCASGCPNTKALLALQTFSQEVNLGGNVNLNPLYFAQRLVAGYRNQQSCDAHPNECAAEQHKLVFVRTSAGACDTLSTFDATTTTGGTLKSASLLKNKLIAYGQPSNPYLSFSSTGDTVTIDPLAHLVGGTTTAAPASCLQAGILYDPSHAQVGRCCMGPNAGQLVVSSDPAWLICQAGGTASSSSGTSGGSSSGADASSSSSTSSSSSSSSASSSGASGSTSGDGTSSSSTGGPAASSGTTEPGTTATTPGGSNAGPANTDAPAKGGSGDGGCSVQPATPSSTKTPLLLLAFAFAFTRRRTLRARR
jgi:MYXO-CTERM domain-containing protein